MVRSVGIAAVVVGVIWTGLAGAQSSAPPGTARQPRYIIVSEENQQPQRCKVLRTWQDSNGAPAFQVQAVETGEMMTILGSGPPGTQSDPRAMSTRIFRWGRDNKPPAGVPMPPPLEVVQTGPPPQAAPIQPTPVATPQPTRPPVQPSWPAPQTPISSAQNTPPAQPALKPATPVAAPQPIRPTPQPSWPNLTPSASTVQTAPPMQPAAPRATPVVTPQPIRLPPQPSAPARLATIPPLPPAPAPAPKPALGTTPTAKQQVATIPPLPPLPASTPNPVAGTTTAAKPPLAPIAPLAAAPVIGPKPVPVTAPTVKPPLATLPPFPPALVAVPKPTLPPLPAIKQPQTLLTSNTSSNPAPSPFASQTNPLVPSKPPSLTPMSTQVVKYSTAPSPYAPNRTLGNGSQPPLVPAPNGTVIAPNANCGCSSPCNTCQTCTPCNQSSCVNCTPPPLRQRFLSRLFKSNSPSTCTEVACQPAQPPLPKPAAAASPPAAIVQAPIEPAKPRDWRESWGKVEPWKETVQVSSDKPSAELTKRVEPVPVPIDPPKQPDPLKAPAEFRDLAMQSRPSNSKIPDERRPAASPSLKSRLFTKRTVQPMPTSRPVETAVIANAPPAPSGAMPPPPPGAQPQGRTISMAADEPNAFWSPEKPAKPEAGGPEKPRINAFERVANDPPPQGAPPRGPMPMMMPPGSAVSMMPPPPRGPMMMPPRPPMPPSMSADTGVPDALGNAFTVPGTRRPIPADFGGTPQEPNGFDPVVQAGQGSPPQAYSMAMPGMPRPPMPNMMAMGQHGPMGMNTVMSVPSGMQDPHVAGMVQAPAPSAGVPQMLATLKDSMLPSEREAAVEQLGELNWRIQPMVVDCLMKAARDDPAPMVRAACVHALAHMKVDTPESVALVRELKSDRDPHVRQEAEEALSALGDSGIQQASHK